MDYLIYIGRFQPFHCGHLYVLREALQRAPQLIILLGSSQEFRTLKNIWTAAERAEMIRACLSTEENQRLQLAPIVDMPGEDERWRLYLEGEIQRLSASTPAERLGLIGHSKDSSSYYLRLFPRWQRVELPNHRGISATPLRALYLQGAEDIPHLPPAVADALKRFRHHPDYARLQAAALSE